MAFAILLLLVVVNGLLALSEIAVVSAKKVRLRQDAENGSTSAAAALALAEDPTRFLSTVQVGITLVSVLSGVFGEAALSDDVRGWLEQFEPIKEYARVTASVVTVMGITYLSLVIGELVPKRIALSNPERIAKLVSRPMTWLSKVGAPIVWVLSLSTDIAIRPFGRPPEDTDAVTEDEVRGIIEQAAKEGVLGRTEHELVERVLRLGDRQVRNLMVPRTEIEWLDADASVDQIRIAVATAVHSHFPVCRGTLQKVVGVVHVKDLVRHLLVSDTPNLGEIARPPLYLPEATPALKIPERFRGAGTRFAFVVDEYGGVEGVITLNDVLEALIGDAATPEMVRDSSIVRRADGSLLLDGSVGVDQIKEVTGIDELPEEEAGEYTTLAGMVTTVLGRIPRTGELFQWEEWRFEVVDMDGPRVDKVLAERVGK
jgi:putative hemolysin